ncbi:MULTISPECIES: hypothetical protein [Rahnella]|jgi:hypothetical protein|uniref:Uncharacterized protein n=1 Tax=Rahnella variigena TaxID=574964 RepID=A0ABX9PPE1_9GAMM|nr:MULTISPECIES: hypothetical protein [Rahnella]MDH2894735.1 hypothetical protein [Rahnella variigena]RBQ34403.1 hypothetical protein C2125_10370 [Rahnella aquatilis]RJT53593.1 hypothetical protein D6D38_11240 [Rahnella variigena]RKF66287.1 hypothetical protein CKQ54_23095 [Rahnella variigena]RYJ18006.1 hypothetical protein C5Y41_12545 [Rahnella variigena]
MSEVASSISVGDSFTVKNGSTHEVTGFVKKGERIYPMIKTDHGDSSFTFIKEIVSVNKA